MRQLLRHITIILILVWLGFTVTVSAQSTAAIFETQIDSVPIREGVIYRSVNIVYKFEECVPFPECYPELDRVAAFMDKHPEVTLLEIGVFADQRLPDGYVNRKDECRAVVIRDYLVAKGIDAGRLTAKGYFKEQPVVALDDIMKLPEEEQEEAHARNRRTEFKILKVSN